MRLLCNIGGHDMTIINTSPDRIIQIGYEGEDRVTVLRIQISQYSSASTLIPAGTKIKIIGIRL